MRLAVVVERRIETESRAKSGRKGVKRRELVKELGEKKAKILTDKLKERGLWQWDEDWPNDEEDS